MNSALQLTPIYRLSDDSLGNPHAHGVDTARFCLTTNASRFQAFNTESTSEQDETEEEGGDMDSSEENAKSTPIISQPRDFADIDPQFGQVLLDGMGLVGNFLLDAEAEYLCGAPRYAQSEARMNNRCGCRKRYLRTRLGNVLMHVPTLRYMHPRPSMAKRFRRLQDSFIAALTTFYREGASIQHVQDLIRLLWTVELTDAQLTALTPLLIAVLEKWRGRTLCVTFNTEVSCVSI